MNDPTENKRYFLQISKDSFSVDGVTNVTEYTDKAAVLKIVGGVIEIYGSGINLLSLDTEKNTAKFSGNVTSLKISDKYVKPGLWGKVFK